MGLTLRRGSGSAEAERGNCAPLQFRPGPAPSPGPAPPARAPPPLPRPAPPGPAPTPSRGAEGAAGRVTQG
ncbi:hypothetical protein VULLAG_LOCUS22133 [Vulpes lagopus]